MFEGSALDSLGHWKMSNAHRHNHTLFTKAGLCLRFKRREEITKGRDMGSNNGHRRSCSLQPPLLHIPSLNTWLLNSYCVLGLEVSQVCVG